MTLQFAAGVVGRALSSIEQVDVHKHQTALMALVAALIAAAVLCVASCRSREVQANQIELSVDPEVARIQLLERVPLGVEGDAAKAYLEECGFDCKYSVDEGKELLWCDLHRGRSFGTEDRWQVLIDLKDGLVSGIDVHHGIIGL